MLQQSICSPTINKGFFVLGMQAPLDLSTCKELNQQLGSFKNILFSSNALQQHHLEAPAKPDA